MLKRGIFWFLVLLPGLLACLAVSVVAIAIYVIDVTNDAKAFDSTIEPIRKLARAVYERHRSIWQAQSTCTAFDEDLFYKPRPGTCVFNNVEFSTVMTFDSRGFRKTGVSGRAAHQPIRGRVVVVGDSQAMGWGVQDEETFASVLAAEYGFEVFNLAVSSYGTARELLRLEKEFALQEDDVVVIQYHPNDLGENLAFLKPGGLPRHVPSDLARRRRHEPQSYGVIQVTASIVTILHNQLMSVAGLSKSDTYLAAIVSNLSFQTLPGHKGSATEGHAETFLAVIDRFPLLDQSRMIVCEVSGFGQPTSFVEDLERLADGRVSIVKPVWDKDDFYRLDGHLTPTGHRKLGHLIAAAVLAN